MPRLLILGRNGQLAEALSRRAVGQFDDISCAGRAEADMATPGNVTALIHAHQPDAIINAAAYTAVDQAETEADIAHRINCDAAAEAAHASREVGARFIQVSTDYVFGGGAGGPYSEDATPAPLNVYGQTKLAGESAVLEAHPEASVVRTAGVFSGRGRDFPSAIWSRASKGQTLRVVDDQLTCPTFADDLADRLIALTKTDASGVFHCSGQPGVSWYEFAVEAVALLSADVVVTRVTSADFPRPAPRPSDSRLSSKRLEDVTGLKAPDWQSGLQSALDVWRAGR